MDLSFTGEHVSQCKSYRTVLRIHYFVIRIGNVIYKVTHNFPILLNIFRLIDLSYTVNSANPKIIGITRRQLHWFWSFWPENLFGLREETCVGFLVNLAKKRDNSDYADSDTAEFTVRRASASEELTLHHQTKRFWYRFFDTSLDDLYYKLPWWL